MAKFIKSQNFTKRAALMAFAGLNPEYVEVVDYEPYGLNPKALVSHVDPSELNYPYGWYFAKGNLRNKHNSDSGLYFEIPVFKPGMNELWDSCVLLEDMEEDINLI
ncbi:MAG: hypothetical protein J6J36_05895 [Clostridia bacterium]|nr:hypothetical protein [Clostridia bacterium]